MLITAKKIQKFVFLIQDSSINIIIYGKFVSGQILDRNLENI